METMKIKPKRTRCPDGTRKNKKGDCVKYKPSSIEEPVQTQPTPPSPSILPEFISNLLTPSKTQEIPKPQEEIPKTQEEESKPQEILKTPEEPTVPVIAAYENETAPNETAPIPTPEIPTPEIPTPEIPTPEIPTPEIPPNNVQNKTLKHRKKYCPKGSRRNRKGQCIDAQGQIVPEIESEPVAPPSENPPEMVVPMPVENMVEPDDKKTRKSGWNAFLAEKENIEHSRYLSKDSEKESYDFLYPDLNDPFFNAKIARRKEFRETQFDGTVYDIAKQSDALCSAAFELLPHQRFVRNFLSMQTPYNGLLLYHGLGTGKTCSAIGVAEEMRRYMQQVGLRDKILVVASPNVQGNFRSQLFDESKLVQVNNPTNPAEYTWNIESCVGDSLLREIDPNSVRNMPREKIVSNIQTIVNTWYEFMGYGQLANYIMAKTKVPEKSGYTDEERRAIELKKIRATFNNRFVIIDEVHNISQTETNKHQTTGALLMQVAKYATNMRLLLLSATPMFDSYKEIVWLTNLLNVNDKRSAIDVSDVFDSAGNFREKSDSRKESGSELLERKLTGYVSYVRGENPYTFPFRVYPDQFGSPGDRIHQLTPEIYPKTQINGQPVPAPLKYIKTYTTTMAADSYQSLAYKFIVASIKGSARANIQDINSFDILQKPMEYLNIVYPNADFERAIHAENRLDRTQDAGLTTVAIGENGLNGILTYQDKGHPLKHNFEYKSGVVEKYGRVLSPDQIGKYSRKMSAICESIRQSEGIVLVYSQYIDGGVVPLALALEEMGFAKFGGKSLFKKAPVAPVDATTMKPGVQTPDFQQATYIMITGDKMYSPNNNAEIAHAKKKDNRDGSKIKVILISKAGSEGIDFKHIRQIHILEPWFNMNRIEQIIGRGVRNLSHCALPFEKRNVQIFLHSTRFEGDDEEPVDLYVYRLAERKSVQIGKVSRLLKTIAVDCQLNVGQTNMTAEKLTQIAANQRVEIQLSNKQRIRFRVGDQPGTDICDYMDTCEYTCLNRIDPQPSTIMSTYTPDMAESNIYAVSKRIRDLYREQHVYKRDQLIRSINIRRTYPIEHVFQALSKFIENRNDLLVDKYGRTGYLVNRGEYYAFQPVEIGDESASTFDRNVPVDYKREKAILDVPTSVRRMDVPKERPPQENPISEPMSEPNSEKGMSDISLADDLIELVIENSAITEHPTETKGLDKNWYRNCSTVVDKIVSDHGVSREQISNYVVAHTLDEMSFDNKMVLVRHFFNGTSSANRVSVEYKSKYEQMIVDYFEQHRVFNAAKNKQGILLANKAEVVLSVWSPETNDWVEGTESDFVLFKTDLAAKHIIQKSRLNRIVGYIVDFKDKEMIFKFKDITLTRNKLGARCDSAGKADIIKMLNMVLAGEIYTQENTGTLFQPKLCVILEMLLREYTRINKDNRLYFLTPEQSILAEITRFTTTV